MYPQNTAVREPLIMTQIQGFRSQRHDSGSPFKGATGSKSIRPELQTLQWMQMV
jgi:hypothetical protein